MSSYDYEGFWESLDYSGFKLSAEELHAVLLDRFTWDFSDKIADAIRKFFTEKLPSSQMIWKTQFDDEAIEVLAEGDQLYVDYAEDIYTVISACIQELETYQIPEGRKIYNQKAMWPAFDDESIRSHIENYLEKIGGEPTDEERARIRSEMQENILIEKYIVQFEQEMYQHLKELAVLHFPAIMNISGTGYRELDYLLCEYAKDLARETLRAIPLEINRYDYPAFNT